MQLSHSPCKACRLTPLQSPPNWTGMLYGKGTSRRTSSRPADEKQKVTFHNDCAYNKKKAFQTLPTDCKLSRYWATSLHSSSSTDLWTRFQGWLVTQHTCEINNYCPPPIDHATPRFSIESSIKFEAMAPVEQVSESPSAPITEMSATNREWVLLINYRGDRF